MTRNHFYSHALAAAATAALICVVSPAHGQQQAPPSPPATSMRAPAVESVVSREVVHPHDDLEVTYTLSATAPLGSNLNGQRIRFEITESGLRDVTLDDGKVTQQRGKYSRSVSVNTGKHKTLAQLAAQLRGVFRQFLVGAAPNQDLGKVGDARYGGELHFVAQGSDRLRFDYVPSETKPEDAVRFSRADVQAFLGMLK